jgi:hypothetical protein
MVVLLTCPYSRSQTDAWAKRYIRRPGKPAILGCGTYRRGGADRARPPSKRHVADDVDLAEDHHLSRHPRGLDRLTLLA